MTEKSPLTAILLAATIGLAAACTPIQEHHGYVPDDATIEEIQVGVHDHSSVSQLFGAPITIANFDGETWFYMRRHTEQIAFFSPEVKAQDVLAVKFDNRGIVADIRRYSVEDGQVVEFEEAETPTRGKELTFIQQLFGNLGRFTGQEGTQ